jgi:hypothetical protein
MHKWWDGAWIRRYLTRTPVRLGNKIAAAASFENLLLSSTTIAPAAIACLKGNFQARNFWTLQAAVAPSQFCSHGLIFTQ